MWDPCSRTLCGDALAAGSDKGTGSEKALDPRRRQGEPHLSDPSGVLSSGCWNHSNENPPCCPLYLGSYYSLLGMGRDASQLLETVRRRRSVDGLGLMFPGAPCCR